MTSLESHIGRQRNLLEETPEHCRQLFLDSPILTFQEFETIKHFEPFRSYVIDGTFAKGTSLGRPLPTFANGPSMPSNMGAKS